MTKLKKLINIDGDIINDINKILNNDFENNNLDINNKDLDTIYNNDGSKFVETIKIKDTEKNISYNIILYFINNVNNILNIFINMSEKQNIKKYIILEIILNCIKKNYKDEIDKYNNCEISIKIYPKDNNKIKVDPFKIRKNEF